MLLGCARESYELSLRGVVSGVLQQEQATALHRLWMMDYGELKDRLMLATSGLVIAGAGIAFTVGGWDVAAPFLAGGVGGIFYCWLLQRTVDAIPAPNQYSPALREWVRGPCVRLVPNSLSPARLLVWVAFRGNEKVVAEVV